MGNFFKQFYYFCNRKNINYEKYIEINNTLKYVLDNCELYKSYFKKNEEKTNTDIKYSLKNDDGNNENKNNDFCKSIKTYTYYKSNQNISPLKFPISSLDYIYNGSSNIDKVYHLIKNSKCNNTEDNNLLNEINKYINESLVDKLFYYIKQKNLKDSSVYKNALIDKRLYSKIITDKNYKPCKDTIISLSIGLNLNLVETIDLLDSCGYTLSHSNPRDIILEYFIKNKIYDIIEINITLYNLGLKTLSRNK